MAGCVGRWGKIWAISARAVGTVDFLCRWWNFPNRYGPIAMKNRYEKCGEIWGTGYQEIEGNLIRIEVPIVILLSISFFSQLPALVDLKHVQ